MLTWAKLALVLLQVVNKIIGTLQQDKYINIGYDRAIAEQAALILKRNTYANQAMEAINALDANATDKLLQQLEPET
jgi:hypothetical protein